MSEEKRKAKVVKCGSSPYYLFDKNHMVFTEIELPPLTAQDRYKLNKAEQLMNKMEEEAPKRKALAQLELHERADKAIKLERELIELKEAYRIYARDYAALLEECTKQKIQLEYVKTRSFWTKFKDLFRA